MSIAFRLTVVLILPATSLAAPPIAHYFIGLGTALILACVAFRARAADIEALWRASRHLKLIVSFPAIWIVLQLLPLPFGNASIWASANEALKITAWGHGTVDIGRTSLALLSYLALLALTTVTLCLSSDRARAGSLLLSVTAAALILVAILIGMRLLTAAGVASVSPKHARDVLGAASVLGLILSLATTSLRAKALEKLGTRDWLMNTAAVVVSIAGLALAGRIAPVVIAALGLGTYLVIGLARRFGIRRDIAWIALLSLIVIAISVLAFDADSRTAVSILMPTTNAGGLSSVHRALADAGLSGTGAGTYQAIMPIYRSLGEAELPPPTTIVALAIELGWPATLLILLFTAAPFVMLVNGALTRVRDSVFATTAAACLIAVTGQAFLGASLIDAPALAAMVAVVLGIGLAQRLRRGNAGSSR